MVKDYSDEAETLFRAFAKRHDLSIEKIDETNVELLLQIPKQPGLSFDITLVCQNCDELNIGVEPFWSTFFPFEKVRGTVERALDGLISGDCTILTQSQFDRPVRRLLQMRNGNAWDTIAIQVVGIKLWLARTVETRLSNI